MATQIHITNKDYVKIDDKYHFSWNQLGSDWLHTWLPNTIHVVIWNDLEGPNEIQKKDVSTGNMTGNVNLTSTSDAVGNTTVAGLLSWATTRSSNYEKAVSDWDAAYATKMSDWVNAGNKQEDMTYDKTWEDFDPSLA